MSRWLPWRRRPSTKQPRTAFSKVRVMRAVLVFASRSRRTATPTSSPTTIRARSRRSPLRRRRRTSLPGLGIRLIGRSGKASSSSRGMSIRSRGSRSARIRKPRSSTRCFDLRPTIPASFCSWPRARARRSPSSSSSGSSSTAVSFDTTGYSSSPIGTTFKTRRIARSARSRPRRATSWTKPPSRRASTTSARFSSPTIRTLMRTSTARSSTNTSRRTSST